MKFVEKLPDKCPPNEAADSAWETIYRLLESKVPTEDAFCSHAALGKKPPHGIDVCRWSACSLVLDAKKQKLLPKFKDHKWAAKVAIPKGAGLSLKTNTNHVSFWRGSDFDILGAVQEVVDI